MCDRAEPKKKGQEFNFQVLRGEGCTYLVTVVNLVNLVNRVELGRGGKQSLEGVLGAPDPLGSKPPPGSEPAQSCGLVDPSVVIHAVDCQVYSLMHCNKVPTLQCRVYTVVLTQRR